MIFEYISCPQCGSIQIEEEINEFDNISLSYNICHCGWKSYNVRSHPIFAGIKIYEISLSILFNKGISFLDFIIEKLDPSLNILYIRVINCIVIDTSIITLTSFRNTLVNAINTGNYYEFGYNRFFILAAGNFESKNLSLHNILKI